MKNEQKLRFFYSTVRSCVACLFASCMCMLYSSVRADDGADLVLKAYRTSGGGTAIIRTCSLEFSLISVQPIPDDQWQKEVDSRRDFLLEALQGHKEPERLLAGLENSLRENLLTPQHIRGTYLYRISDDQQRQSLFTISYQNSTGGWSAPTTVMSEVGPQRIVMGSLDSANRAVEVLRQPAFIADFYLMGRITGAPINSLLSQAEQSGIGIANVIRNIGYQKAHTENYDDSHMSIVEHRQGNRVVERYGIDSSRDYVCPLIQIFDAETGHLVEEYVSRNYFQHEGSGHWFPTHYLATNYNSLTGELVKKQEYTIDSTTVKINPPVSEHEFSIDVPAGFFVNDARDGLSRYRSYDRGEISLAPGGLDFGNMNWLSQEISADNYIPPTGGAAGWTRWLLASIGIGLILFILLRSLYKKWQIH